MNIQAPALAFANCAVDAGQAWGSGVFLAKLIVKCFNAIGGSVHFGLLVWLKSRLAKALRVCGVLKHYLLFC